MKDHTEKPRREWTPAVHLVSLAVATLAAGAVLNPGFLLQFSSDGRLSVSTLQFLAVLRATFVGAGAACLALGVAAFANRRVSNALRSFTKERVAPSLKNMALTAATLVLLAAILEIGLALRAKQAAHHWEPPVSRMTTSEFSVENVYNRAGFRNNSNYNDAPAHGVLRIMVVGDSYVEGWGVDFDSIFHQVLHSRLTARGSWSDVECINLGKAGHGPLEYLETIRTSCPRLKPHIVVLAVYMGNDILDSRRHGLQETAEPENPGFAAYAIREALRKLVPRTYALACAGLAPPKSPRASTHPLDSVFVQVRAHFEGFDSSAVRQRMESMPSDIMRMGMEGAVSPWLVSTAILTPDVRRRAILMDFPGAEILWHTFASLVVETNQVCAANGCPLVICAVPSSFQVDTSQFDRTFLVDRMGLLFDDAMLELSLPQDRLRALCKENGIPYVDPLPLLRMRARDELFFYRIDTHLTPSGHRLVAQLLERCLDSTGLLNSGRDHDDG